MRPKMSLFSCQCIHRFQNRQKIIFHQDTSYFNAKHLHSLLTERLIWFDDFFCNSYNSAAWKLSESENIFLSKCRRIKFASLQNNECKKSKKWFCCFIKYGQCEILKNDYLITNCHVSRNHHKFLTSFWDQSWQKSGG